MTAERMMTLTQLAERLNVTPKVIYGLRYRSEAPRAIRVGRELRFAVADVEAWEAERRDNGGPRADTEPRSAVGDTAPRARR